MKIVDWVSPIPALCGADYSEGVMKASVLFEEAISLPVEERAHLVDCLLQTLNPPDVKHEAAWAAVARRRLDELRSGKVVAVSGEDVFARIRLRYTK